MRGWNPPPKYASQSVRSACGRDAQQQELRRKNSQTSLSSSASVRQLQTVSGRNSARRGGDSLLSHRLFNNAHISPVLTARCESEGSRAGGDSSRRQPSSELRSKSPHQQSLSRLPISGLQVSVADPPLHSGERSPSPSFGGASSSRSISVSARQDRRGASSPSPRTGGSVTSSPAPTFRESAAPQLHVRSQCPNLGDLITPKSATMMSQWYTTFEAHLSSAFPDVRCPYVWLDPFTQGPDIQVLERFDQPWTFADWKQEWDHPDSSQFSAWCEAHRKSRKGSAHKMKDLKLNKLGHSASNQDFEVPKPLTISSSDVLQKARSLQDLHFQHANIVSDVFDVKAREGLKVSHDWQSIGTERPLVHCVPTPVRAAISGERAHKHHL